jgi:hypothetical protein
MAVLPSTFWFEIRAHVRSRLPSLVVLQPQFVATPNGLTRRWFGLARIRSPLLPGFCLFLRVP